MIAWCMQVTSLQGITENSWFPLIAGSDYPDWMWPWVTLEKHVPCAWDSTNAGSIVVRVRIQTDGWVHCYKGGGGGDIQDTSLVTIDHVYPVDEVT